MIETLIENIISFKSDMTYQGLDFQVDLVAFYEGVRSKMGQMFPVEDFGPSEIKSLDTDLMAEKDLVIYKRRIDRLEKHKKDGYGRVKAKIKELRTGYKDAIDRGTRSGSGRLVYDHYDKLHEIWRGCPSVKPLGYGRSSGNPEEEEDDDGDKDETTAAGLESDPMDKGK